MERWSQAWEAEGLGRGGWWCPLCPHPHTGHCFLPCGEQRRRAVRDCEGCPGTPLSRELSGGTRAGRVRQGDGAGGRPWQRQAGLLGPAGSWETSSGRTPAWTRSQVWGPRLRGQPSSGRSGPGTGHLWGSPPLVQWVDRPLRPAVCWRSRLGTRRPEGWQAPAPMGVVRPGWPAARQASDVGPGRPAPRPATLGPQRGLSPVEP